MERFDRLFVRVWEESDSLTEVSVRLDRLGYDVPPDEAEIVAEHMREDGIRLKIISRSALPDFAEVPQERESVNMVPPSVAAECQPALCAGTLAAWEKGAAAAYAAWYVQQVWPFKPGSND